MAITPLTDSLDIISALPDEPNDVGGLTAAELKAKFDEGGKIIKSYINNTLIPGVEAEIDQKVAEAELASGNIPVGGQAGQVLMKNSGADYDCAWRSVEGSAAPVPGAIMQRDMAGRAQAADPVSPQDVATKAYADTKAAITLTGESPPTAATAGVPGQLYADTSARLLYQCTAAEPGAGGCRWDLVDGRQVGEIAFCAKNSLGGKYLLANGQSFDAADYPELFNFLSGTPAWRELGTAFSHSSDSADACGFTKAGGYYVITGSAYTSSTSPATYYAAYWYTASPGSSTWTRGNVASSSGSSASVRTKMVWTGAHYVVIYTLGGAAYVGCSAAIGGPWTTYALTIAGSATPAWADCLNGYIVVGTQGANFFYCPAAAVANGNSVWAATTLPTGTYSSMVYAGGNFVTVSESARKIVYSDSLSAAQASWAQQQLDTVYFSGGAYNITFQNGLFIVTGTNSSNNWVVGYSPQLGGGWQYTVLSASATNNLRYLFKFFFFKGKYFTLYNDGSYIRLAHTSSLSSSSLTVTPSGWFGGYVNTADFDYAPMAQDRYLHTVCRYSGTNDNRIRVYASSAVEGACRQVPNVSLSGAYAFVRALP